LRYLAKCVFVAAAEMALDRFLTDDRQISLLGNVTQSDDSCF
jgi:hypothetical protein